jgi:hypothetical protein
VADFLPAPLVATIAVDQAFRFYGTMAIDLLRARREAGKIAEEVRLFINR